MNAFPFQRCFRYTCTHPYIFRLDHAFQSLQVRWKSCTLPQISQQSMVQHESPLYCTQCTSLCWNASQSVKTGCFYRDMYLASYTSWGSALQALLSLFSVTCFLEPLLSSYALLISFYPPNGNVKYRIQQTNICTGPLQHCTIGDCTPSSRAFGFKVWTGHKLEKRRT